MIRIGHDLSGRKQHHFWQTLQRGFGTQRKSNYTKVYVYQKDKPPFDTDTRNNGAERDFFDFSQGSGADELITNIENEIQNLVKHYQNGGPIEPEHSTVLSVLIAHLEIRTKFLRQSFAETTSILMKELNRWFSSPDIFKK